MHQTSSAPFALFRFLGRVGVRVRLLACWAAFRLLPFYALQVPRSATDN